MNDVVGEGRVLTFPDMNGSDGIDLQPGTAYEVVTRTKVEELAEDVREIRARIDGIFWLVAGSIVADILLRVMGVGR
ncbi:MAG: hypothetical protein KC438_13245 [Thermomicrobiales bacterium]|nr:hypothetical protein [Thermomicrobiales bacterium]MCO5222967.1 hypothetical protein [Thermomicrobiales bacterium]